MADPRFGEHFEQAWDAVLRGEPVPSSGEPWLAETIRRLHAVDRVPPPDPAFVTQVRKELLAAAGVPLLVAPEATQIPDGRATARPAWLWQRIPTGTPERRRWAAAQLVTMLLLLLTLLAAYFAFGPGRPHPAVVPTVAPTPATGVTVTPLGVGVANALPDEPSWLMTFQATFRPGGRYGLEPSEGPDLVAVISGSMTYHADQPLVVTRGAGGSAAGTQAVVPVGTDAVLSAGDSVLIPLGAIVSRRNDGAAPAIEVMAMLEGTFLGTRGRSAASGVTETSIVTFHISDAHQLPPAPAAISLSRVTLAPAARFVPPSAPWWMVATSEDAYGSVQQDPDGTTLNTGPGPIDLYLTTVESLPGGAAMP